MNGTPNELPRPTCSQEHVVLEPVDTNSKEQIWGQMLYVGRPNQWMAPEAPEDEDLEPHPDDPESIYHLPSFLDPRTSCRSPAGGYHGSPRDPVRPTYYRAMPPHCYPAATPSVHAAYALAPQPQLQYGKHEPQPLKAGELAPRSWPHYTHRAYNQQVSRPAQSIVLARVPSRVFCPPAPADLAARLQAIKAFCNRRAQAAEADTMQQLRDSEDGHIARPSSPPPSVLIPPPSGSIAPAPPAPCRSPTPFHLLQPLPIRFPRYFDNDLEIISDPASDDDSEFEEDGGVEWGSFLPQDDTAHSMFFDVSVSCADSAGSECGEPDEIFYGAPEPEDLGDLRTLFLGELGR
ncbi:hypothetical protein B0H17DRAFT_1257359 [Mycena rosella]|uniref:Uncharacterized protein n=1 Tax=Mycena rosella TaxID=1033263 RepID=A0AAD7G752_MYCRO|nr:hypothetical protein B0H17DRAFT_1257359 [Mycena rosella]